MIGSAVDSAMRLIECIIDGDRPGAWAALAEARRQARAEGIQTDQQDSTAPCSTKTKQP